MHVSHRRSLRSTLDLVSPIHNGRHTAGLPHLARRLWSWIMWHHRARLAAAELASLSDHMLADIGVSRGDLTRAARRRRGE